jgi:ABC-type transport system involved in cytochrome bd biosynthesis fused ATPase/permease subunit
MAGRTVILVTHRHGWPGGADRVLTLDHGRLLIPALDEPAAGPIAVGP